MAPSSDELVAGRAPGPGVSTSHGFALLATGHVLAAAFLNRILLDEQVVAMVVRVGGASPDEALAAADRWVLAGYVATPLLLFARVGAAALLIQLALLPFLGNPPLGRIFRASLWGGPFSSRETCCRRRGSRPFPRPSSSRDRPIRFPERSRGSCPASPRCPPRSGSSPSR